MFNPTNRGKYADMPKHIAAWLKLPNPENYTGHAYPRTGATLLANGGGTMLDRELLGGWLSDKVAGEYVENLLLNKRKIGNLIMTSINVAGLNEASSTSKSAEECYSPPTKRVKENSTEISTSITKTSSPQKALIFQNCQVTIHYQK